FHIFDVASRKLIATPPTLLTRGAGVRFSPDGKFLAVSGFGGLTVWEISPPSKEATDEIKPELHQVGHVHGTRALRLVIDAGSKWVVWVDEDTKLRLYDLRKHIAVPFPGPELLSGWHNLNIHADGRHVLFTGKSGKVEAWDIETRRRDYE